MKTVVLIHAHKDHEVINRLIRSFDHPRIAVYVHLDLKSDVDPAVLDPRARLIKNRQRVYWGEFSQVVATLGSFKEIHDLEDYDHLLYLSGQDYPVWSNERILRFLDGAKGRQFMVYAPLAPGGWPEAADRIYYYHYNGSSRFLRYVFGALRKTMRALGLKRVLPGGLTAYGGSNWFTLTREGVAQILAFVEEKPEYVEYMKSTSIPDEMFFHTILLNTGLRDTIINENHRYVDWSERLPNPKCLTRADFDAIVVSDKMICRKIDVRTGLELVDLLERRRRNA